ncbi:MAG TPA: ribosome maturation factor RimP, partial [Vicinamibacterales bacterium]|nr:ribosome maturation factor RimP [Vicinamibacterales bacterium]
GESPSGPVPTFCFSGVFSTPEPRAIGRLRQAAERVANSHGLEIFDVQLRREPIGMVLRVVIDRPDLGSIERPEDSVGIEECQRVSQDLSALLDVEEEFGEQALGDTYTLEVSSPGLDRPLRHEADFRRFTGRLAKIVSSAPIDRQSAFAGRIAGIEDGAVVLQEGRRTHKVPLDKIKRAHLDVEF